MENRTKGIILFAIGMIIIILALVLQPKESCPKGQTLKTFSCYDSGIWNSYHNCLLNAPLKQTNCLANDTGMGTQWTCTYCE